MSEEIITDNLVTRFFPDVNFTFDDTDHVWMNCSKCTCDSNFNTSNITNTILTLAEDYRLTCSLCNNKSRIPIFTTRFNTNMRYFKTDNHKIGNKCFIIHWFIDDNFVYLHCDKCKESVKLRPYYDSHVTPNYRKIILESNCSCKEKNLPKWNRYRSLMHGESSPIQYKWIQIDM